MVSLDDKSGLLNYHQSYSGNRGFQSRYRYDWMACVAIFYYFFNSCGRGDGFICFLLPIAWIRVPGSRADIQLHMGEDIISSAIYSVYGGMVMGALFILIYFTLYPITERKFPAYLRTEKKNLVWRDLLIPGILGVISIVVGILLIR